MVVNRHQWFERSKKERDESGVCCFLAHFERQRLSSRLANDVWSVRDVVVEKKCVGVLWVFCFLFAPDVLVLFVDICAVLCTKSKSEGTIDTRHATRDRERERREIRVDDITF